jgi:membrane protease YdiL (CAAX protease family)
MSSNSGWGLPSSENAPDPLTSETPPNLSAPPVEDPPFGGIEVLQIGLLIFIVPIIASAFLVVFIQKIWYPQLSIQAVQSKPWLLLGPQLVWFALVTVFLIDYSKARFHQSLWQAIRWNWPKSGWLTIIGAGVASLSLVGLERLLPMPKTSPFDKFFQTPVNGYAIAVLGILFAPFMEELFFRGFLYPVLARRLGIAASVLVTAGLFGIIHYPEYKAWGPVLIVFLVGVILTVVRAWTRSVAASFVVHAIYNGVPILTIMLASHGFQHMEKLAQ